jgi:hypothetical protein
MANFVRARECLSGAWLEINVDHVKYARAWSIRHGQPDVCRVYIGDSHVDVVGTPEEFIEQPAKQTRILAG